jgi:hypothetical protein
MKLKQQQKKNIQKKSTKKKKKELRRGWTRSLVLQNVLTMCKTLGLIPRIKKKKELRSNTNKITIQFSL